MNEGRRLALHQTIHSFGGLRLEISDDTKHFAAGSWGNPGGAGVACYETMTGKTLWHRRDLKTTQSINYEPITDSWIVARDKGGTHFVDRRSGVDRLRIPGEKQLLGVDRPRRRCVLSGRRLIKAIDPASGEASLTITPPPMFSWVKGSTAQKNLDRVRIATRESPEHTCEFQDVLSIVNSACLGSLLVVVHCAGPVQAYDLESGGLLWEVDPQPRCGFGPVGIDQQATCVRCLTASFVSRATPDIIEMDILSGAVRSTSRVPDDGIAHWTARFRNNGRWLVSGNGIIDFPSCQVRRFV
jgi:hypothetical protein